MDRGFARACGLVFLLAVSVLCNVMLLVRKPPQDGKGADDTARVTVIDTIRYPHPVPVDSTVVRYVTARLCAARDTVSAADTNVVSEDTVRVEIPITQKRYADSTYTAWVSGYSPSLDSIRIYPRHEVTVITRTIRRKPKRWGVGLNVGYGITPRQGMQPYVGIGVSCNLFSF